MKNYLSSLLGNRWLKKLISYTILFVVLLIAPKLYFGKKIQLDPAKFTEEWEKIVVTLFLLYLILEYQKYNSDKNKSLFSLQSKLKHQLIAPLKTIRSICQNPTQNSYTEARKLWAKLYRQAKIIDFVSFDIRFPNESIYTLKDHFEFKFINNYFKDYKNLDSFNKADEEKLITCINNLINLFEETHISL